MELKFQQIADESNEIFDWIASFGLDVNRGRVGRYRENLAEIAHSIKNNSTQDINDNIQHYLQALYEYGELSVIYQAFRINPADGLEDLLAKLISGPYSMQEETEKNVHPRNFAFEATLGARMSFVDLKPSFKYTGDVFCESNGIPLYFQCKRLSSMKQTRKRISKAAEQIDTDIKRHRGSKAQGIIALDATKLINPDNITMIATTSTELESLNSNLRDSFIREYVEALGIKGPKRLIGILVRSSCLGFNEEKNAYTFYQGYTVANISGISDYQRSISDRFVATLTRNITSRN